jgi:hypothetical protein
VCLPGGLLYRSTASILRELLFFVAPKDLHLVWYSFSVSSSMVTSWLSPSLAGSAAGDGRDPLDDLIREFTAASTVASPASAAPRGSAGSARPASRGVAPVVSMALPLLVPSGPSSARSSGGVEWCTRTFGR